jgi:hypothetical protein
MDVDSSGAQISSDAIEGLHALHGNKEDGNFLELYGEGIQNSM